MSNDFYDESVKRNEKEIKEITRSQWLDVFKIIWAILIFPIKAAWWLIEFACKFW